MKTGKIHKFIVVPICTVYSETGDVLDEQRMKPITLYSAADNDIKSLAKRLEEEANAKYFSKLKATTT